MADVAFDNISQEVRGYIYPGKLRLKPNIFMFKNEKTGKVDQFQSSDILNAQWIARANGLGLRVHLKNDSLHRYDGFGEIDSEKVASFFRTHYSLEILKKDICYKGYNWGEVDFEGDVLELKVKNSLCFEIPLSNVSNVTSNKNEVVFEFHQNDEAEVCLSEMRLYTPSTEADKEGKSSKIFDRVMEKADIIQVTGDSVVEFKELQCLQPRGRYDIKLYTTFIHLHGKSFDYKVPKDTITRLLMLPHPDNRQMFFVVQLDPPIKHGQTRYHFIIMVFDKDSHADVELAVTETWIAENYGDKLSKKMSDPEYEVVARLFKVLFGQKITVPGSFRSKGGSSAVACSYKACIGLLYPLERGFIFVPRPPVAARFDEVISVQFSRGTGAQRSFDFEIETRNGLTQTFTSIERDEYHHLYDFVVAKKLRVKNVNAGGVDARATDNWSDDSDASHDAYMEKVKTEGRERLEPGMDDEDDDEDDEDFKPPDESETSELAEEYDSQVSTTTSSSEDDQSSEGEDEGSDDASGNETGHHKKHKKPEKEKKKESEKKPRRREGQPSTKRSSKRQTNRDPNAPSRPPTGFMIWLNENREKLKASLGSGAGVTGVAKAGGEQWKAMSESEKAIYSDKADVAKRKYEEELRIYKDKIASGEIKPPQGGSTSPTRKKAKKVSSSSAGVSGAFKSEEYIASSDSSSLSSVEGSDASDNDADDAKAKNDDSE